MLPWFNIKYLETLLCITGLAVHNKCPSLLTAPGHKSSVHITWDMSSEAASNHWASCDTWCFLQSTLPTVTDTSGFQIENKISGAVLKQIPHFPSFYSYFLYLMEKGWSFWTKHFLRRQVLLCGTELLNLHTFISRHRTEKKLFLVMVACMSNVLTASRKGGAGHQTQTKEETLPGDVGLHALCVLWLFPLWIEMVGKVMGVALPGFGQTKLHDAREVTHRRQSITHHAQLEGWVHRLQQL